MKWLVALVIILFPTVVFSADFSITAATGFINEHNTLIEATVTTGDTVKLSASYGMFGDIQYASAGIGITYKRLTVSCAAAYLYTVPDKLTGHLQFKPKVSYRVTDSASLVYIHVSNGEYFLAHDRLPNRGVNFLGVTVAI